MNCNTVGALVVGLFAAFIAPSNAQPGPYFTIGTGQTVGVERIDPLLSQGKVSNHVHSVVGGNAFGPTMDFATTQKSTCSTVPIKADLSNYWFPTLYFKDPKDNTFTRVPQLPYHKIYYKYGRHDSTFDTEMSEFPSGFRMITGNAMLRENDGSNGTSTVPGNTLNWECHQDGSSPTDMGFPKGFTSCNAHNLGGLAASMRFPSCWNGQDFDAKSPLAHMAFPTNQDGMAGCPTSHNVKRFPEVFIENYLDVSPFDGKYGANDNPWVLAQGDNTGFGYHMDFLAGWTPGVLGAAMKTCNAGNSDPISKPECFGDAGIRSKTESDNCRISKSAVDENVGLLDLAGTDGGKTAGGTIGTKLPGCNPIQAGPQLAKIQTNCANVPSTLVYGAGPAAPDSGASGNSSASSSGASSTSSSVSMVSSSVASAPSSTLATYGASSASVTAVTRAAGPIAPIATASTGSASASTSASASSGSSTPSGLSPSTVSATSGSWKSVGCYSDLVNPHRSLDNRFEWNPHTMSGGTTATNCVQQCDSLGKKIAGIENGGQCFCGNSLIDSQAKDGECTTKCNGDKSETCGGPARLSIYTKSGSLPTKKRSFRHRRAAHHLEVSI